MHENNIRMAEMISPVLSFGEIEIYPASRRVLRAEVRYVKIIVNILFFIVWQNLLVEYILKNNCIQQRGEKNTSME